jgi:hypothetical protein
VKAEDSLQAAQEALTHGDVEASTRFRATAAQEFDLAGADRSSELAQLGGRIAETGKVQGLNLESSDNTEWKDIKNTECESYQIPQAQEQVY